MNKKLPKIYEPDKYEDRIYQKWEKSGYFNPNKCVKDGIARKDAESFSIVLPPPNRTGVLHIGHALMLVIQDILTRYHRMKGDKTLWVPGTDHAAIATQSVVEKKLYMEEKKTRHDLGREQFLKRVYEFADKSHKTITRQVKKMGSSLDWSREAYTLDEIRTKTVKTVFKMMSDDGLIYRGDRVINWCPRCHSTLADDEVEYKAQKAKLYTFKYSKDFPFNIATTRPETKLGDTAVAVNPKDKRYKKYIGKTYEVDFVGVALKLKIIADRQVDMKFGTGAVGVTPAHSMADWQMAQDHKLEIVKVINEDGNIVDDFDDYSGKSAEQAREMIVKKLKRQGLLEKVEEMENNLSLCYRCHTPIEPLPSLQWFIDVNKKLKVESEKLKVKGEYSLKELSLHVIKSGLIKIIPKRFEKNYFHWMENLRDWCISRQIWFGHRVPVWYCKNAKCKMQNAKLNAKCKNPIVSIKEVEKCPYCDGGVEQDPDTLDTWFSSGLWTFSTLADNPDQIKIQDGKLVIDSDDFKNFHPTSVMETGYDILFFWVARMIIMATYAVGDIPFQDVYLHGLVRDIKGRKMSKSLGNAIDPLDVCAKYGTDAVRLALIIGATPGNDINLSEEKIAGFRNFTNKLWNISRYILKKTDNNIIGVGALIEIKNGKFLFQKRDKNTNRYSDMIAPFGGGLQKHESCLDCLRREIKEELCININNYNIS
ncbi:MAG: valine--tRNA ligase, partial [Patescibacteria group bacterium]|nr:valine--tRNA ligase [Patescibacteria group bacterium]